MQKVRASLRASHRANVGLRASRAPLPNPSEGNRIVASNTRRRQHTEGIRTRHSRACSITTGGRRCSCSPTYEASIPTGKRGEKLRRVFPSLAEAEVWRSQHLANLHAGTLRTAGSQTVAEALDDLIARMRTGAARTRSGDPYKPSVIVTYASAAEAHLRPAFGRLRLIDLRREHVQRFADDLAAQGLSGQTIRNVLMPLRVLCRLALRDGLLAVSPVEHLDLPASRGYREHVATAEDVPRLLDALNLQPTGPRNAKPRPLIPSPTASVDRAAWALMFYGGLRLGEVQGLRWEDVDLGAGEMHVRQAWDDRTRQVVTPKSRQARRSIPIAPPLAEALTTLQAARADDPPSAYVLRNRSREGRPITQRVIRARAAEIWRVQGMDAFTPHEARHTFGSMMAAAGVQAWDLAALMGHTDPTMTANRYRHVYADERREMGVRFADYLTRADTKARILQLGDADR